MAFTVCLVQMVREKLPLCGYSAIFRHRPLGKLLWTGKNISVLGEKYRNLLGYLPQQFGYYPDFTAWDFLMYVAALKGLSEKQAHKKATELLEAVDLAEKKKTSKSKLSLVV